MFKIYEKEALKLYVGVVDGSPRDYNRDGKVAKIITLKDYKGEKIDIFFFNSTANDAPKADMRADRIVNAKVDNGSFMTILAKCSEEEEKTATGIDFKYRGRWNLKDENGKTTTVLMGTACKPRQPKDSMFCITIPIDEVVEGNKTTKWIDVTFFDGEKDGKKWSNATFAGKCLYNEEKPMVVVAGSEVTEREYNGNTYYSIVGFRITKRPE